jgi:proteic killer suppression protein
MSIQSFRCKKTKALFEHQNVPAFKAIERIARLKLLTLDAVTEVNQLQVPPGNRLEALKGNRAGQYSIRINDQWRLCFRWQKGEAHDVEIVDYH